MQTPSWRWPLIALTACLWSVIGSRSTAAVTRRPHTPTIPAVGAARAHTDGVASSAVTPATSLPALRLAAASAGGAAAQVEAAWALRYDGSANGADRGVDMALDSAGNVYVTGQSAGAGTGADIVTLKVDALGNLVWERRYNGPGAGDDGAAALAVDGAGNVHVAGSAWTSAAASDLVTLKYDADGNLLWDRYYNGPGAANDSATALDVDVAGNVFVAGESEGDGTFGDFATLKYDADGNLLWARRYNGPGNGRDGATALAADGAGGVYVTGLSAGTDATRPLDYATLKYDPAGNAAWVRRLAGGAGENDTPHAIALDDWGNVYVTGELGGYFDAPADFGTVKYDPDGNSQWIRRYNGPDNGRDIAFALALDRAGNAYVTGFSQAADASEEAATLKYDPDGDLIWDQRHTGGSGTAVAVDDAGRAYVAGSWAAFAGLVLKYDRDGTLLWNMPYAGRAAAAALDDAGDVYVAGVVYDFNASGNLIGSDYLTAKYVQPGCLAFVTQWPVDVAALTTVAAHLGQASSDPEWDGRLDVNRDHVIDADDMAWAAAAWGTACDLGQLPAPPEEPASDHIPNVPFPDPDPADYRFVGDGSGGSSLAVSFREIVLAFKAATTVQEANAALASVGAVIRGGLPDADLLLIEVPATDLDQMTAYLSRLNGNPHVEFALVDMGGAPDILPLHNVTPNLWTWELPVVYPSGPADTGNWGLELTRAPQMWNLDTFVRRQRANNQVSAAIIDAGFDAGHADLLGIVQVPAGTAVHDHGTLGAGIIGAGHNGFGIEGVNPWLTTVRGRELVFSRQLASWRTQLEEIVRLLKSDPAVKAINNSYSLSTAYRLYDRLDDGAANGSFQPNAVEYGDFNGDNDHADGFDTDGDGAVDTQEWGLPVCGAIWPQPDCVDLNGDNNPDTWRQVVDAYGDLYQRSLDRFSSRQRDDFFLVASAGNQSRGQAAPFIAGDVSPISNAAVRYGGPFLAVESMDQNNTISNFSFQNGSVAAPGECVRSTEANDGTNFDSAACGWSDGAGGIAVDGRYATTNGTSFSAPYVTGLITTLWKLEPALARADIRALVTGAAFTADTVPDAAGYTARRVDAFAAALGIDGIFGGAQKALQQALVDVDDGTRDGALRHDPLTDQDHVDVETDDRRPGDGRITMRDFRAWRDAYLQVHADQFASAGLDVALDGPATHFKRDLNFDGCVENQAADPFHPVAVLVPPGNCTNAPAEDVFARYDFNGDGLIAEWFVTAPFKADPDLVAGDNRSSDVQSPPGLLRDIDVLADADLWNTVESDGYAENVAVDSSAEGEAPASAGEWGPIRYLLANRDPASAPALLQDVPDYIHSFDLHIGINWNAVAPDYEAVSITVASEMRADFQEVFTRDITVARDARSTLIVTLPLWTGKVRIDVAGIDDELPEPAQGDLGYMGPTALEWTDIKFGADRALRVHGWPILILDAFSGGHSILGVHSTDIALDAAGNVYVAYDWLNSTTGDNSRTFVAAGAHGGHAFTSTEVASGRTYGLAVAGGPADELYGVYVDEPSGSPGQIKFVRSTDGGQSFATQVVSTPGATEVNVVPDVAVDAAGTVYVIWTESGTDPQADDAGVTYRVRLRTSSDGGQTFSAPRTIYTSPDTGAGRAELEAPKVRVAADGEMHVTWLDWRCLNPAGGDCARMYYSRSPDGQSFSTPDAIGDYLDSLDGPYEVVVDQAGVVSVVYARDVSAGGGAGADLQYVRIADGQVVQSKVILHSAQDTDPFGGPSVAVDGSGAVWVAWSRFDVAHSPIYLSRSVDGGQSFSTYPASSSADGDFLYATLPTLGIDASGAPRMAWLDQLSSGANYRDRLLFQPAQAP